MDSPFTPDFGRTPSVLAARGALTADWRSALRRSDDRRRTSLLLSPRGTGKTALLNEFEDIAARNGMLVVAVDTSTSGIAARIVEQIELAHDLGTGVAGSLRDHPSETAKSARLNLGLASIGWQTAQRITPEWTLRRMLTHLATASAGQGNAMLLSVDELHAADIEETRRLAADIQHVAKRESLPLCFVGAALPFFRGVMRTDRKLSFFNRCAKPPIPPITHNEAADFYRSSIAEAGGRISDTAVAVMAAGCGGNAYRMQHIGDQAWTLAGAPRSAINDETARTAVAAAASITHDDLFRPLWDDFSANERRILELLAGAPSGLHVAEFAAVEPDPDRLDAAITALTDSGCVDYEHVTGQVTLRHTGDRDSIIEASSVSRHLRASRGTTETIAMQTAHHSGAVCGKQMTRVPGNCILPPDHSGRCRSKR